MHLQQLVFLTRGWAREADQVPCLQLLEGKGAKRRPESGRPCWKTLTLWQLGVLNSDRIAPEGRRSWKFVLLVAKMDEEARCNEFGRAHYSADMPCSECLCDRNDRPFTDLSAGAAWRETERLPWEACKARARVPWHPLVVSHFCCSRYTFFLDLMHVMDCKGVAASVWGECAGSLVL